MADVDSPPQVEVLWIDAFFSSGWIDNEELVKLIGQPASDFHVRTIGYLLSIDEERVMLSMSQSQRPEDGERVGEVYWIPASCVVSITELEKVSDEQKHS